jgi:hypothetical protein
MGSPFQSHGAHHDSSVAPTITRENVPTIVPVTRQNGPLKPTAAKSRLTGSNFFSRTYNGFSDRRLCRIRARNSRFLVVSLGTLREKDS